MEVKIDFKYKANQTGWSKHRAKDSKDIWMCRPCNALSNDSQENCHTSNYLMIKLSEYDPSNDYPFIVMVKYNDNYILEEFKVGKYMMFLSSQVTITYRPKKYIPPIGTWYSDLVLAVKEDEDVKLVSSDGVEFYINKLLFAGRSEVFKKMLDTPMKEGENKTVQFKDIHSNLLKSLVHYLKNDSLDETDCKDELIELANMYDLPGLFKLCEDCLLDQLKGGANFRIAYLGIKFGSRRLIKAYSKSFHRKKPY